MTVNLRTLTERLARGDVPDLYGTIHTLGDQGYVEAKRVIEQFLCHPDPEVRYIALNVLVLHWQCQDHRKTCERFITNETDPDNRELAVAGLGALLTSTRDPAALKLLLSLFKDEGEDPLMRSTAYRQILQILGKPPDAIPGPLVRFWKHVNENWVEEAEQVALQA